MAETREDLDARMCELPECPIDHSVRYISPKCHATAGVEVTYTKATGYLEIWCKECSRLVMAIEVASGIDNEVRPAV